MIKPIAFVLFCKSNIICFNFIYKGNFQNKRVITVLEGSISFQKGKTYSAEARLQRSLTEKSSSMKPFLLVRSPTKDLIALGGSITYKAKKLFIVDISLSKIVSKDMKFFGMLYFSINIIEMIHQYHLIYNLVTM